MIGAEAHADVVEVHLRNMIASRAGAEGQGDGAHSEAGADDERRRGGSAQPPDATLRRHGVDRGRTQHLVMVVAHPAKEGWDTCAKGGDD